MAILVAIVPAIRAVRWVRSGSTTQYADYWLMVPDLLRSGGGLRIGGLFDLNNEHLVAVPKLLYWVNVQVAHGSNRTLGLIVLAIVGVQVALIVVLLARTELGSGARVGMVAATSGLLYSPLLGWNFLRSMSGAAWLTGNLFVLAAIVARSRGRTWWACALGALACASYGTGLAVWPALLLLGWMLDREIRRQWPIAASAAAVVGGYWALRTSGGQAGPSIAGPRRVAEYFLEVLGAGVVPYNSPHAGTWGTTVLVMLAAAVSAAILVRRLSLAAPWIAIAVYGIGASMVVALGRARSFLPFGSNRHASLGSLAIIGTVGVWCTVLASPAARRFAERRVHRLVLPFSAAALGVAVGVASAGLDRYELDRVVRGLGQQDRLALALRFDLAEGDRFPLGGFAPMPRELEELLASADHTPFSDSPGFECGLAGAPVPDELLLERLPDEVDARVVGEPQPGQTALYGAGWLRDPRSRVRCVVVLDRDLVVVGAGAVGRVDRGYGSGAATPPGALGFTTVRPIGTAVADTYLVLDDGRVVRVPEPRDVPLP